MTLDSFARLKAAIQRRLADFLELAPTEGSSRAAALEARIGDLSARLGAAVAERRRIERERAGLDAGALRDKAERAIDIGRDDLALAALQSALAIEERAAQIEASLRSLDAEAEELERAIRALGCATPQLAAKLLELDALIASADQPQNEA